MIHGVRNCNFGLKIEAALKFKSKCCKCIPPIIPNNKTNPQIGPLKSRNILRYQIAVNVRVREQVISTQTKLFHLPHPKNKKITEFYFIPPLPPEKNQIFCIKQNLIFF